MTLPIIGEISPPLLVENTRKVAGQLSRMATAGKISPLMIVDNNKICPKMTAESLWLSGNKTFANLFGIFNKISSSGSPYTSFDSADYHSIMKAGGCTIMGMTEVDRLDTPFAISEAVKRTLKDTLFTGGFDLSTAKLAGCIVIGGKELMANVKGLQSNIDYAFGILSEVTGQATVHRGIYEDDIDALRVFTIIGGLDGPTVPLEEFGTSSYHRDRVNVVNLKGPPLNQRRDDILPLAEYFLANQADSHNEPYKVLSLDTKKLLLNYPWPGDVRELANAIERAYVLTIGREIQFSALPFKILTAGSRHSKHKWPKLDKIKREIIIKTLKMTKGNKLIATKILGIEPHKLNRLIKNLNINQVK